MAQENKISLRQLRRILFIETFGTGALSVPALACYKGQSGFVAILFYGIFFTTITFLFYILSEKMQNQTYKSVYDISSSTTQTERKAALKNIKSATDLFSDLIQILYILRFFINAAALFYFFGKTIQTVYMPENSLLFILFPAAILLWYSLHTNLQKRARFLELIFPWIIIIYIIAVILSFLGIENAAQTDINSMWPGALSDTVLQNIENAYFLLLCSSPIEFLLFLKPATEPDYRLFQTTESNFVPIQTTEFDFAPIQTTRSNAGMLQLEKPAIKSEKIKPEKLQPEKLQLEKIRSEKLKSKKLKPGKRKAIPSTVAAMAGVFFCNMLFAFLAVRTLGQTLASQSAWPVIKMMQLIKMPGGFLERFDILPIVFWILCMIAVLSGYLYYGRSLAESLILKYVSDFKHFKQFPDSETFSDRQNNSNTAHKTAHKIPLFTAGAIFILLLFTCLVEKQSYLWTFYLKYKAFVDFPLSLLLPFAIYFLNHKKERNATKPEESLRNPKEAKQREESFRNPKEAKQRQENLGTPEKNGQSNIKQKIKWSVFILTVIITTFSLSGCQRLTDVEEKNYILSLYIDYPSDEANVYEFWMARADLNKMEERNDEIPCQITKIKAKNLQELEEKYIQIIPGKIEWNHIYTIFLGPGIMANQAACIRFLKEWDNSWQKSPNVLLARYFESPEKLYKIKNIPEGAAGQEVSLLVEQNKRKDSAEICETPIDYLRAKQEKKETALYRITIEDESCYLIH